MDNKEVNLKDYLSIKSPKALINADPVRINSFINVVKELLPECNVSQSMSHLIEIMPEGISKSNSLTTLCLKLNINHNETMAIGDNINDIDMVKWASVGVAVSNSVPQLKEIASYICKEERSLGVKEAIEKYCF